MKFLKILLICLIAVPSFITTVSAQENVNVTTVGDFDLDYMCTSVLVNGDYAYLSFYQYFQVVNISNPRDPVIVDQLNINCSNEWGNTLYLRDDLL